MPVRYTDEEIERSIIRLVDGGGTYHSQADLLNDVPGKTDRKKRIFVRLLRDGAIAFTPERKVSDPGSSARGQLSAFCKENPGVSPREATKALVESGVKVTYHGVRNAMKDLGIEWEDRRFRGHRGEVVSKGKVTRVLDAIDAGPRTDSIGAPIYDDLTHDFLFAYLDDSERFGYEPAIHIKIMREAVRYFRKRRQLWCEHLQKERERLLDLGDGERYSEEVEVDEAW